MRCVLAPAGYGKTTMLHTAAQAATADGRPVVAVATTAKAVAELAGAGLDARTIARLRIDLTNGPLAAGTVVVLDEISQTPTREVEAVLAAVDACPGGSMWILGDPRQSQPVGRRAGWPTTSKQLATSGRIPSARLTVNRRQVDPTDRQALRPAPPRRSHRVPAAADRAGLGARARHARARPARRWPRRSATTSTPTGPRQVAALVVSHTDAEDLADRIRARLAEAGVIGGPIMTGPGWTTDRDYQAGDRVLLHARCGPSGSRLVNGTHRAAAAARSEPGERGRLPVRAVPGGQPWRDLGLDRLAEVGRALHPELSRSTRRHRSDGEYLSGARHRLDDRRWSGGRRSVS